jgi:hypothetical protein
VQHKHETGAALHESGAMQQIGHNAHRAKVAPPLSVAQTPVISRHGI